MSANNYRFCPQCSETEEQIIAEARKQYGKIPEDDYMQLLADERMERDIAAEMLKTYPEEARNIRQVMSYKQSEMKAAGGLE